MFLSRVALSRSAISRVPGVVTAGVTVGRLGSTPPPGWARCSSSAPADSTLPPRRWTSLEPELEEVLVPRRMSLSPLESWLSLRYSLPALPSAASLPPVDRRPEAHAPLLPPVDGRPQDHAPLLPPALEPVRGGRGEGVAPLSCKNVLEIRRRKMNRHKYRKLRKRTVFLRRRVLLGRRKKKQRQFERDLKRIWTRAGLKNPPEGWNTPKIYIRHHKSRRA